MASVPFRHTKYLFCGQLFCLNVALRVLKWLLIVGLSSAVATTDFNRMQNLAMQRYGDRGANTVAEWRQLINEVTPLDELQLEGLVVNN